MIKMIPPSDFKQIPWKNGKGITTELAISEGGTLDNFDWRISIASVVEDGVFSDFSGYLRHLILIQGNGIKLSHDNNSVDKLEKILDYATFNGASKTVGQLINGPIKDLNIMTDEKRFCAKIATVNMNENHILKQSALCFIYSLSEDAELISIDKNLKIKLPQGHLTKLTNYSDDFSITGYGTIVIYIDVAVES